MKSYAVWVSRDYIGTFDTLDKAIEKANECEKARGLKAEITTGVWHGETTVDVAYELAEFRLQDAQRS